MKNHLFAKDGWNYRTAYFEDFNGNYYSFQISVGKNGKVNTIYNVNRIQKEAALPKALRRSAVQSATVGSTASMGRIAQEEKEVNKKVFSCPAKQKKMELK